MDLQEAFAGDFYLKQEFEKLVKRFKIKNIVETGTYLGNTTKEFSKMVPNVYTIEISKPFYELAKKKLKDSRNVKFFLGNSPDILKKILPSLKGKTLFFLDAHWNNYWPILDELREISRHSPLKESVIVIHDFYVPGKDFGFDSYHNTSSSVELFFKKILSVIGRFFNIRLVDKQRLDYSFIEEAILSINPDYRHYYNSKAIGEKRGVIFLHP